jgi:glutamate synthase (NADPH/NADH) small chain
MGKATGFIEFRRSLPILRKPQERVKNWNEFHAPLPEQNLQTQGARCMNCGIPFCHAGQTDNGLTKGCPLHNLIPEWNDLVYHGRWFEAYKRLALTNNFPEFTGRVCPAPCESSCVLGINEEPVMIKEIEVAIIDRAFEEGWIVPNPPKHRTGKRVAVVGSGPAGLACADELNKSGHTVIVYERADRIGGLLMYGIPNMKLDKFLVERRVNLLAEEGIEFRASVKVGIDISAEDLKQDFDAIVLTTGAPQPRDLQIEGRHLKGIHFAMDFLTTNTKSLLASNFADGNFIDVKGKNVIVIGGGDTGTDCIASSLRFGCRSVKQFEIMPQTLERVLNHDNWLGSVRTFQTDYGQEEAITLFGSEPRRYKTLTKRFVGDEKNNLIGLETVEVEWVEEKGKNMFREVAGTEKRWNADAVFLAMGFLGAEKSKFLDDLGVELTTHKTISVNKNKQTNIPYVFAAGDCERGQSLVVWAIADGRNAAKGVNDYLM